MKLEALQREMAAAVMMPLTGNDGMQAFAKDGRPMAKVAASFVAENSRLTAFERLEIYNRQYWFRVLDALAEDFTALAAVVGRRRFEALSVAYLTAHPSRSFTLRNIGSRLVEWLAANPEFAGRRAALALDIARLEWAHVEAFDGGELATMTGAGISRLSGDSQLTLQPHLRLLALGRAADELVIDLHRRAQEVKTEETESAPVRLHKLRRRSVWLAAHRVDDSVYYRRLEREEYLILRELGAAVPLTDAIERALAGSRHTAAWRARKLGEWFERWAELGWLCQPAAEIRDKEQV